MKEEEEWRRRTEGGGIRVMKVVEEGGREEG